MVAMKHGLAALFVSLCLSLGACSDPDPAPTRLSARAAAVLVEGCALTPWQSDSLAATATPGVISEVVLLCPAVREGALLGPTGTETLKALRDQVSALRGLGYRVSLGLSTRDETGVERPSALVALLGVEDSRARFNQALVNLLGSLGTSEGLWLHLPNLPAAQGPALTRWVGELSALLRPARRVVLLAPPSSQVPSDIQDGDTLDLASLAAQVDQITLMTLDYSDSGPGPVTDSDWIQAVLKVARGKARATPLGFALPTYGIDYGAQQHQVSYLEAAALADTAHVQIERDAGGALHFAYTDRDSQAHTVYFNDARASLQALGDLQGVDGAVLFYSLGWEDPALWTELERRLP